MTGYLVAQLAQTIMESEKAGDMINDSGIWVACFSPSLKIKEPGKPRFPDFKVKELRTQGAAGVKFWSPTFRGTGVCLSKDREGRIYPSSRREMDTFAIYLVLLSLGPCPTGWYSC
jgi:hypothetical protein